MSGSSCRPVRVLQSVGSMDHGGVEHFLMNVYRSVDTSRIQFDFIYRVNSECAFDAEIQNMGGKIFRCPSPDRRAISSTRLYMQFFRDHPEYRVVHEHRSTLSGLLGFLRLARASGVPTRIVHSHNSNFSAWYGTLGNAAERLTHTLNKRDIGDIATDYFACSDRAAAWMFPDEVRSAGQVRIIPNGIDTKMFAFDESARRVVRQRHNIPTDAWVVGHIGRFAKAKNQSFLVDIIASVPRERRPYLLLLGDGSTMPDVYDKAAALAVLDHVVFAGVRNDACLYYSAMDVFCMPSIYEGLPVSAVEAQANGLPVLLSEAISRDTALCDKVGFMRLEDGADSWGLRLESLCSGSWPRTDGAKSVSKAGFDIVRTAAQLQAFYLDADARERRAVD